LFSTPVAPRKEPVPIATRKELDKMHFTMEYEAIAIMHEYRDAA
jgi:hypothetical protein